MFKSSFSSRLPSDTAIIVAQGRFLFKHVGLWGSCISIPIKTPKCTHPYFCFIALCVTLPHSLGQSNCGPGINAGETWQSRVKPEESQCCVYGLILQ